MKNDKIPLDGETSELIQEISALSGYGKNIIKECFEFLLLNWAIKVADNADEYAELTIPYLGKIGVKYDGDSILPSGEMITNTEAYVEISPDFKKIIGDIHDEGYNSLIPMIEKKIENAVLVASTD